MPSEPIDDCEQTVSELKRLQAEHQLILDAAGEGIYGLNCQGETTFLNAAAVDILGKPIHDIHHHSHADGSNYPREECPIYAALKDGEVHRVDNEVFGIQTANPSPWNTPAPRSGKTINSLGPW